MGLMCSLLGHEYGEPETEREREERGDEVVEYVRTVEYCDRCERERIVSESTEVRSVQQAPASVTGDTDDDVAGDREGLAAAFERVENEGTTSEPARVSEPAEFVDAAANAVAGTSASEENESTPSDGTDTATADVAGDDDAELLTDDGPAEAADTTTSAGGATAESSSTADDDADESPSDDLAAEEPADEPTTDDAVILTDDGTEQEPERERGAWPSSDDTRETERTVIDVDDAASNTGRDGIASAGPIESTPDREGGELVCPECGKRTGASGSSLRAGDICPDCHRGYLAEAIESA